MALYEHDIEFGKIGRNRKGKVDADTFSGKVLQQFMKGKITGEHFTKSNKIQKAQASKLGTMSNFMKSDLRLQASTNQFVQRDFKLNKKSLTMVAKYYDLDKKTRSDEKEFYKKTKESRRVQFVKDNKIKIWRRKILKNAKKIKQNTETLQWAERLKYSTKAASGVGSLVAGGIGGIHNPFRSVGNTLESKYEQNKRINIERAKIELFKEHQFKMMSKNSENLDKATKKYIKSQLKQFKKEKNVRYKEKILESQGIGAKQTIEDAKSLRAKEREAKQNAKLIGGAFTTDEEKAAKKALLRQAKEYKILRKRGFSEADVERQAGLGVSRSDLVASGIHRRRTFNLKGRVTEIGGSRFAASSSRAIRGGGRFLRRTAPGLAVLGGAALAVNEFRKVGGAAGIGSAINVAAEQIPVVAQIKDTFEQVADLIPKGVKDWFGKASKKFFSKMWQSIGGGKLAGPGSQLGSLLSMVMDFLDVLGSAIKLVFNVIKTVFLSAPVQNIIKSFSKYVIETGKTVIMAATGVMKFFTDIFGDKKKSFGQAFMDNLWPVVKEFALNFVPALLKYLFSISVFGIVFSLIKNTIVGKVGGKIAGFFGIRKETLPGGMGKSTRNIQEGQDKVREARITMARIPEGPEVLEEYFNNGQQSALDMIKEKERTGKISHSNAETLRHSLIQIKEGETQEAAGVAQRKKLKEDKAKTTVVSAETKTPAPSTTPPKAPVSPATILPEVEEKRVFKSESLAKDLRDASATYGIPLNYLQTLAKVESGGNPNAVSSTGAVGIFQFTRKTGMSYGLVGRGFDNRRDQRSNIMAGAKLARDNAAALANAGLPTTSAYLYLAHQQGVGGVQAIVNAARTGTDVPSNIRRNMDVNGGRGLTPAQFLDKWEHKWDKMAGSSGGPIGPPSGGLFGLSALPEMATGIIKSAAGAVFQSGDFIAGKMSALANKIMTGGEGFATGLPSLPNSILTQLSGAGSIIETAFEGAKKAAEGEMERMRTAMNNALTNDPSIQMLSRSTTEMSGYTHEMAHKEDKNLLTILDKSADPFKKASEEILSSLVSH